MSSLIKRFVVEDSGMEMLEWAIVATLFAVVIAAGFKSLGTTVKGKIDLVGDTFK